MTPRRIGQPRRLNRRGGPPTDHNLRAPQPLLRPPRRTVATTRDSRLTTAPTKRLTVLPKPRPLLSPSGPSIDISGLAGHKPPQGPTSPRAIRRERPHGADNVRPLTPLAPLLRRPFPPTRHAQAAVGRAMTTRLRRSARPSPLASPIPESCQEPHAVTHGPATRLPLRRLVGLLAPIDQMETRLNGQTAAAPTWTTWALGRAASCAAVAE